MQPSDTLTSDQPPADLTAEQQRQYDLVAQAIHFIHSHARQQPSLAEIAAHVNLSEYHLQRLFSRWAGISPKRFLQFLTKEYAKGALRRSDDLLSTTLESGLSSPGRLHDLMVSCEAMTPGEIKQQGLGVTLEYGSAETPFGLALLGWTARGLCHLAFYDGSGNAALTELRMLWPLAELVENNRGAQEMCSKIFPTEPTSGRLHLLLKGTNFQIKVWEALLNTQSGQLLSYGQLARLMDSPNAQRAVGSAVGANKIGFLIPCHRVIRESGDSGQYRWGNERKQAIQVWEANQINPEAGTTTS